MSNTIDDLRTVLFDTIKRVREKRMSCEEARAINDLSQTVINTAKAEIEFLRLSDERRSGFFRPGSLLPESIPGPSSKPGSSPTQMITARDAPLPNGISSITRHVLQDD